MDQMPWCFSDIVICSILTESARHSVRCILTDILVASSIFLAGDSIWDNRQEKAVTGEMYHQRLPVSYWDREVPYAIGIIDNQHWPSANVLFILLSFGFATESTTTAAMVFLVSSCHKSFYHRQPSVSSWLSTCPTLKFNHIMQRHDNMMQDKQIICSCICCYINLPLSTIPRVVSWMF